MFKTLSTNEKGARVYFSSNVGTPGNPSNTAEKIEIHLPYRGTDTLKAIRIRPLYSLPPNDPSPGGFQLIFNFPDDSRLNQDLPVMLSNKDSVKTGVLVHFDAQTGDRLITIGYQAVSPIVIYNVPDPTLAGACEIDFEIEKGKG